MNRYKGSCHCKSVRFEFSASEITSGLRCNCSICKRKSALMTPFTVASEDLSIQVKDDLLATYSFGSGAAKQHFCKNCGIYTFHETRSKAGHYRINIGCLEQIDVYSLPFEVFDGASI